jgi:hypothetical protein
MKRKSSSPVTHQMAALFDINQGRVSEVITGKRHPNVAPRQHSLFD